MARVSPETRRPRGARVVGIAANFLIVLGLIVALFVAGIYVYSVIEERRSELESQQLRSAFDQERAIAAQQASKASAGRSDPGLVSPAATRSPRQRAQATAQAKAAAPSPARRIIIPSIGVDSPVVESEIKNGEWVVPKFFVGHLQGTAQPNQPGNAVYSGHIESISSGNVFERIGDLHPGDRIYLLTADGQYLYEVKQLKVVSNNDLGVVQPTADHTVTLITCTGTWDYGTRDYLQRLVIVAKLYQDASPSRLPIRPR